MLKSFHSLDLKLKSCLIALFGSAFLAFGLYHVHSFSGVTEGGVLGMTLLLDHWFHISPSVSGFIMNLACYAMGWKLLGRQFIAYSILSSASFSLSYRICEQFPPLWPQLADMPLAASLLGAVFVGVGALAMSLSHVTHIKIQWIYLLSDFAVLVLSLSYIPLNRMVYSILTVLLSGQIIGFVQTVGTHPVENMKT